jgi:hypothetical protein
MARISSEIYEKVVMPKPFLWWWVQDKEKLSLESVVQGVLACGDMDDVKKLFELVGRSRVKVIFLNQVSSFRHNYRPQTESFFRKVFSRDV